MADDLRIGALHRKDIDAVVEIMTLSFGEERAITGFDPERVRRLARFMMSPPGRALMWAFQRATGMRLHPLVGRVDGVPVATTILNVRKGYGYISSVAVHPDHRRRGIARRMMEAVIRMARREGASRAVLHVASSNSAARSLYHGLGFERFEVLAWFVHTRPEDLLSERAGLPVTRAWWADTGRVLELVSGLHSPAHLETTPLGRSTLRAGGLLGGRSAAFICRRDGRLDGYAACQISRMVRIGHVRNPGIPRAGGERILRSLVATCGRWLLERGAKGCVFTIEEWSGTEELVRLLTNMGFSRKMGFEGMRLDLT